MFTKQEIKEFIIKASSKWLFPDLSNKITWFVVSIGGTILLTPTVFKQLIYNWLVDTINLNAGQYFTLAELQSDSPDYFIGTTLIVLGLFHNIIHRYLVYKSEATKQLEIDSIQQVDKSLFKEFLDIFPSDSLSIELLKNHGFANSFHENGTKELDHFVKVWHTPEKEFLDTELELYKKKLWHKCKEFHCELVCSSHYINSGPILSCIPEAYRTTEDWPKDVDDKIEKLDKLATECFELHRGFVQLSRRKLKC